MMNKSQYTVIGFVVIISIAFAVFERVNTPKATANEAAVESECGADGNPCSCNSKVAANTQQATKTKKGGCGCGKAACSAG